MLYRDKFRLPTGAEGLKDDNLGKRTIWPAKAGE